MTLHVSSIIIINGCMDGLHFHIFFQQYFSHIRTMGGDKERLCAMEPHLQWKRFLPQVGSRSLGLFRKGKTLFIAKTHRPDLVICSHSTEWKILSYSQINTVQFC